MKPDKNGLYHKTCIECGRAFGTVNKDSNYCFNCDPDFIKNGAEFKKSDNGKLEWSLMPFDQLEQVVKVLMNGANKYGRENWKKCDDVNRYKDALMRHTVAYVKGEKIDDISKGGDGLSHLAHAICNCLFLMYFDDKENGGTK